MLAQLLTSKPKTNLINLLLAHPARAFSYTELRISSGCLAKLLKETLKELDKMDFLSVSLKNHIKYYQMNKRFPLYAELVNLLRKVKKVPDDLMARNAAKVGDCKLVALTGLFVGKPRIETDLLFVGKISPTRLRKVIQLAEKFAEQDVNYTVFTSQEYEYRKIMSDRFLKNILENEPVLVVDKTKHRTLAKLVYKM